MRMRIAAFLFLNFFLSLSAHAQECQACKSRVIILYDNEVTVPRPTADKDSIYRYWDYFFIAGGVKDYIMNTDPTSDCLVKLDGAFFTVPDTVTSNVRYGMEHANTPPAGSAPGAADYIIHGSVSGSSSQSFTLKLEAGKTREVVKSGIIALPSGFDPFERGKTVAAFIGPIYTSILNFEKKKRDEGEPYAIQPKVTLTPAKKKLKPLEKTTIDVLFMDCDDVPLKNRNLIFTSDAGVLTRADCVTDEQGKAVLEFTAGPKSDIANITTVYPFKKATGDMDAADVEPAVIQIEKPSSRWFLYADMKMANTSVLNRSFANAAFSDVAMGTDRDWTDIEFSAWVENINPQPGYFTSDPANYTITYFGSYGEYSYFREHREVPDAGFRTDNNNFSANAVASRATLPKPDIRITGKSYSFSIGNMTATQNGTGTEVSKTYNPSLEPPTQTSTTPLKADPETILRLSVQGPNMDTTYSTNETTTTGDLTVITRNYVKQKFSWKDDVCVVNYLGTYSEENKMPGLGEVTKWDQTYTVQFVLSYAGDPPTAVKIPLKGAPVSYALLENYPNPFNPATTISFAVPKEGKARLTVSNALGQDVAELFNGIAVPGMSHRVLFDAKDLPSGVYFARFAYDGKQLMRKLVFLK